MGGPITAIVRPTTDTPQKVEGSQTEVIVSDDNTQQLLSDSLKELKKINLHMQIMTDMDITNREVE